MDVDCWLFSPNTTLLQPLNDLTSRWVREVKKKLRTNSQKLINKKNNISFVMALKIPISNFEFLTFCFDPFSSTSFFDNFFNFWLKIHSSLQIIVFSWQCCSFMIITKRTMLSNLTKMFIWVLFLILSTRTCIFSHNYSN